MRSQGCQRRESFTPLLPLRPARVDGVGEAGVLRALYTKLQMGFVQSLGFVALLESRMS